MHDRLDCLEERTDVVEEHITEMAKAHNELLDAHDHHTDEIQSINLKLADLEDRSIRNNIKFRGIPESVLPNDLKKSSYNNSLSLYFHIWWECPILKGFWTQTKNLIQSVIPMTTKL